jgi:RNA polymerase sigma factor (sigma-70 family)
MVSKLSSFMKEDHSKNDEWIAEHYPQLHQYCQFLSQNKWDGEDLVQETLMKTIQHYHDEQNISPALLNKIAYHQWIDMIRKRKHEIVDMVMDERVGEQEAGHVWQMEKIEFLLKQITPKQAVAIVLKEAFQYRIGEIAEILNTTETAVKSILFRAKRRLDHVEHREDFQLNDFLWDEADQLKLLKLIKQSFYFQDPTILISLIPSIDSLVKETKHPKLIHLKHSTPPTFDFLMVA